MRKIAGFLKNLGINLLLNLWGIVPCLLLLIGSFLFDISFKWALFAFGVWVAYFALRIMIAGFFVNLPKPTKAEEFRENKNPYSKK